MSILTVLLLLAMCATLAVLVVGLVGFFLGGEFNAKYGNKLMRARVALQARGRRAASGGAGQLGLSRAWCG